MHYKIFSMNLRYPSTEDGENIWQNRFESVAAFINKEKPLVIGTQELFDFMYQDILRLTKVYKSFGVPRESGGEGVPILYDETKLELITGGNFWLSDTPLIPESKSWDSACIRMCTWAEFSFKDKRNKRFRLFNTHLDHVSLNAQKKGINVVLEKIKTLNSHEYLPTFLLGDFNATIKSDTINFINKLVKHPKINIKSMYDKNLSYGASFHNFTGNDKGEPIDHIYYSIELDVIASKIYREKINNRHLSDHYPIGITINL